MLGKKSVLQLIVFFKVIRGFYSIYAILYFCWAFTLQ